MCDVDGLVEQWVSTAEVRDAVKDSGRFVASDSGLHDIKSAVAAEPVLMPILRCIFEDPKNKLPYMDPLRAQVSSMREMFKWPADEGVVGEQAWILHKLLGFVKMKARKEEPSTAAQRHLDCLA